MTEDISRWDEDIQASVVEYNNWYLRYTADSFRRARAEAEEVVEKTLEATQDLRGLSFETLWGNPGIIRGLRMTRSPHWAVDRLIGISGVPAGLVKAMENNATGRRKASAWEPHVQTIITTLKNGYDLELLPWLADDREPAGQELELAKQIMIDRLALSIANPDIRNEQEHRQLKALETWLRERDYQKDEGNESSYDEMAKSTYRIHVNARGRGEDDTGIVVQVDVVIMPTTALSGEQPIMMECKSAGDFANVNKRRKEEADKHGNLVREHGDSIQYVLYLSGYFDSNYLRYERAAGIQWIWHHRINDLERLGL